MAPSILTPDEARTRIGTLRFFDGLPDAETVETVYEHLDFLRGVRAFLQAIPGKGWNAVFRLYGPQSEWFDQTWRISFGTWLDLSKGAVIVESPPNTLGIVDDFFFRYVADLGNAGPDEGKGGLNLFVPPEYRGQISERYFNYVSRTRGNSLMWRGFLDPADPGRAVQDIEKSLAIYPLEFEISDEEIDLTAQASAEDAEAGEEEEETARFVRMTGKSINTIHSNDFGSQSCGCTALWSRGSI